VFMVGWSADILLWPLRMLGPQWAAAARGIGVLRLAVALLAALALLFDRPDWNKFSDRTEAK
jgi:hypothetical protein